MSLINQMLKELDARRTDAGGGSPFGGQVRAVPDRRRTHPAWWLVFALAVALAAVLVWGLLRPPADDPYVVRAQLPLKLEVDIGSIGAAAAEAPAAHSVPVAEPVPMPPTAPEPQVHVLQEAPPVQVQPPISPAVAQPQHTVPTTLAAVPLVAPVPTDAAKPERVNSPATQPEPDRKSPLPAVVPPREPPKQQPIIKHVRELTPAERAENEFRKATLAVQQGRRADAQVLFEQALRIDAKHVAARQALIAVLLDAKRNDEALQRAREGLDLDPRQGGLAMILARLQLEKKDLDGAIETLERSRPYAGDRVDYIAFLAALLQRDERHKEAVEQYVLALQRAPDNGLWWMGMGISLQAEQRMAEAMEAFQRARASGQLTPDLRAFVEARLAQLR